MITHAKVIRRNGEIKVMVSDMEKPNEERDYTNHRVWYERAMNEWKQSFKEYPVKDEKEWIEWLEKIYTQLQIDIFLTTEIEFQINPSLVVIVEPDVNSVTMFEPFATLSQPVVEETYTKEDMYYLTTHIVHLFASRTYDGFKTPKQITDDYLIKRK
jgi:hypothetical protein